jgi:hypothetical protein
VFDQLVIVVWTISAAALLLLLLLLPPCCCYCCCCCCCCVRFHVQGDFLLPSSREGLLEDSPYNLYLRDQVRAAVDCQHSEIIGCKRH